jgi:hypothetical protein
MKSADADRQAGAQDRSCQIDSLRKLVRLNPDQTDKRSSAGATDDSDDPVGSDAPVGFVVGV